MHKRLRIAERQHAEPGEVHAEAVPRPEEGWVNRAAFPGSHGAPADVVDKYNAKE